MVAPPLHSTLTEKLTQPTWPILIADKQRLQSGRIKSYGFNVACTTLMITYPTVAMEIYFSNKIKYNLGIWTLWGFHPTTET